MCLLFASSQSYKTEIKLLVLCMPQAGLEPVTARTSECERLVNFRRGGQGTEAHDFSNRRRTWLRKRLDC